MNKSKLITSLVCALSTALPATAQTTKALPAGATLTLTQLESKSSTKKTVSLKVTSASGISSGVTTTLAEGESASYSMDVTAINQDTDFYLVCPAVQTSTYLGVLKLSYPVGGDIAAQLIPPDSDSGLTNFSASKDSTSFSVSEVAAIEDSIEFGSPVEEEYSGGFCFDPTVSTSVEGDFLFEIPLNPPTELSAEQCAVELAKSCSQPIIYNRNLIFAADSPGAIEKGSVATTVAKLRRTLSRALNSKDLSRLKIALRNTSKSLVRRGFANRILSAEITSNVSDLRILLRDRKISPVRRAKRALPLLKRIEGLIP